MGRGSPNRGRQAGGPRPSPWAEDSHPSAPGRLTARPGASEVEILATDGQRALRARVAAERTRRDEALDIALKTNAVRAMARTKSSVLTIETDGKTNRIVGSHGAEQRFGAATALQTSAIRRPLDRPRTGAVARKMPRTAALRALRAMPAQRDRIRRVSICRTACRPGDQRRSGGSGLRGRCEAGRTGRALRRGIVFGIDRSMLTAALRTMTGRTVTLHVEAHDRPIVLTSEDGRETVAIATKRL